MDHVYAIDFGTSNSLLAAAADGRTLPPVPLQSQGEDATILRSLLYTPQEGAWFFGDEAISAYGEHCHAGRIFRSLKKFLPDPAFEGTKIHGKTYSLVDLIALFLRTMRERANAHFGADVHRVVLGKPAVYSLDPARDELACQRMEAAARLAGFNEFIFCPEPLAAAYEFRHELDKQQVVLIADFGGGTSDFTVLTMGADGFEASDILAIDGLSIAGDAFDGSIMRHSISPHFGSTVTYRMPLGSNELGLPRYLVEKMCSAADISFLARGDIMRLLRDAQRWSLGGGDSVKMDNLFVLVEEHLGYELFAVIEQCKKELSQNSAVAFEFRASGIELFETIERLAFERHAALLVNEIVAKLDATVAAAGLSYSDIQIVCCTGGTARIPLLRGALAERFGEAKLRDFKHFHSVIAGLAQHALLWSQDRLASRS